MLSPQDERVSSRLKWGARPIGIDNEYVLTTVLGLPLEKVKELESEGVIYKWNPEAPSTCPPPDWDGRYGVRFP